MEQTDRDVEETATLWPRVRHGKKSPVAVVAKRMKGADVHAELQQEDRDSYRSGEASTDKTTSAAVEEESYEKEARQDSETGLQALAWILAASSFLYLVWHFWRLMPVPTPLRPSSKQLHEDLMHLNALSSGNGSFWEEVVHEQHNEMREEWHGQIPKLIHQTYKSEDIPEELQVFVRSWKRLNPTWKYVFYNDTDCLEFIEREFPQYLSAYKSLPRNVERSDFFRYLVILRYGGIYADLDTECMVPMDEVLQPEDTLLVGWECDMGSEAAAAKRHFVRKRQVLQWVFAATPGHPVLKEICEFIGRNAATSLSNISSNHDTLERTGPGVWTDTVMRYVNSSASHHRIRILPQVAFGVHPRGTDGLKPGMAGILVQHHFWGSWKSGGWGEPNIFTALFRQTTAATAVIKPAQVEYFPVSVTFDPSFMIMVNARCTGQLVGTSDVGSELTLRGTWQAGGHTLDGLRVVDVLTGTLESANSDLHLLDLGAGLGFFSLAAASRHHPVIAFEPSLSDMRLLQRSIEFNEFQERIQVHYSVENLTSVLHPHSNCTSPKEEVPKITRIERTLENKETLSDDESAVAECQIEIGVIRIGNSGWSAWKAMNGSRYLDYFSPEIVAVEFSQWTIKQAGWVDPFSFLNEMVELGYDEMYHAGDLCESRWEVLSRLSRNYAATEKPAWCNLSPTDFAVFHQTDATSPSTNPENILFVKRKSNAAAAVVS